MSDFDPSPACSCLLACHRRACAVVIDQRAAGLRQAGGNFFRGGKHSFRGPTVPTPCRRMPGIGFGQRNNDTYVFTGLHFLE